MTVSEASDQSGQPPQAFMALPASAGREFVSNEDISVRCCILPVLPLSISHYPVDLHALVAEAIRIARTHPTSTFGTALKSRSRPVHQSARLTYPRPDNDRNPNRAAITAPTASMQVMVVPGNQAAVGVLPDRAGCRSAARWLIRAIEVEGI
jgi:hypothetical protein